jgi:hypothetical protein
MIKQPFDLFWFLPTSGYGSCLGRDFRAAPSRIAAE